MDDFGNDFNTENKENSAPENPPEENVPEENPVTPPEKEDKDSGNNGTYPYGNTYTDGGYPYNDTDDGAQKRSYDPNWNKPEDGTSFDLDESPKRHNGVIAFVVVVILIIVLGIAGLFVSWIRGAGTVDLNTLSGDSGDVTHTGVSDGPSLIIKDDTDTEGTTADENATQKEAYSAVENEETATVSAELTTEAPMVTEVAKTEKTTLSATDIYQKVYESSVGIIIYTQSSQTVESEGSGVILSEDSEGVYTYIITCAHCISDIGITIYVKPNDTKEEYKAEIVGYDTRTDIGVIRIKASGFTPAEFGNSDNLKVGDTVYAIGNPGGYEFAASFTRGMVSGISRPISSDTGYTMECIQHDAAINPGNSGGALVNEMGQVIGINSMKIVDTDYEGMGFAVPSSVVADVVNDLIATGYVPDRAKLGITYRLASYYNAYNMVINLCNLPAGTVIIEAISDDSPLVGTDVGKYDLIVAVNGANLDDSDYLRQAIENSNVGDMIRLSIVRVSSDYSVTSFDVTVALVEDKGTTLDETTTVVEKLNPDSEGNVYDNP